MRTYKVSYTSCPMDYRWYLLPRRSTSSSLPEGFEAFEQVAVCKVLVSPEWGCGLTIDVMIACVHASGSKNAIRLRTRSFLSASPRESIAGSDRVARLRVSMACVIRWLNASSRGSNTQMMTLRTSSVLARAASLPMPLCSVRCGTQARKRSVATNSV
jgi:hypothetical protein